MNQLAIDFAQRRATARTLGTEAGERCRSKADEFCPGFSERALNFIAAYASTHTTFSGEVCTWAMKEAGIRAHDDRAFGPIYRKAATSGLIRVVGAVPRSRGHGARDGKLYMSGAGAWKS